MHSDRRQVSRAPAVRCSASGEVVGINSLIFCAPGAMGLFAIPIDIAVSTVAQLRKKAG
jgi:S1-C subfamily serine protease